MQKYKINVKKKKQKKQKRQANVLKIRIKRRKENIYFLVIRTLFKHSMYFTFF